jgi:hypothetical protein
LTLLLNFIKSLIASTTPNSTIATMVVVFIASTITRSLGFTAKQAVTVGRSSIVCCGTAAIVAAAAAAGATSDRQGYVRRRAITTTTSSHQFLIVDGRRQCSRRRLFTTNSANEKQHKHIPSPTWSIKDLELTSTHPPLPQEELERLARLVLIDINNDNNDDDMDSLKQDLGNMIHMIQHVTEYDGKNKHVGDVSIASEEQQTDENDPTYGRDAGSIYDAVRGVKSIPLRKGIEDDPLQEGDTKQAQEVWDNFLQPKTINRGGGHAYFAIETTEK